MTAQTHRCLTVELLDKLEARWRAQRLPAATRLNAGRAAVEIDAVTAPLGLRLPAEARTWWGWHDGVSATQGTLSRDREIGGPGFQYLPLADAVAQYQTSREIARSTAANVQRWSSGDGAGVDPDDWWNPAWFPITVSSSGTVITCDTSTPELRPTPILAVSGGEPAMSGARSFGEMVTWWIEAFDSGAWRYDTEGGEWDYSYELLDPARELTWLV